MAQTQRNHIDIVTLLSVVTLMVLSLGVVYSASSSWAVLKGAESERMLMMHALKVLAAFACLFGAMHIDYHRYRRYTKSVLLGAVALLGITLIMGAAVKGATRWLSLGGFGFQPSELAKVALLFHLCVLMADRKERIQDFKTGFLPMMVWVGLVTTLVMVQPNFSTGALLFGISLLVMFVGRVRIAHIGLVIGALVPLLVVFMLAAEYRMRRLLAYFGGGDGGSTQGSYQLTQGLIGFGSGGVFGLGPGNSRQRELFLPQSYDDFIFPVIGEEYGLIGTLFVMLVFLVVMLRGMRIARHAPDELGRLLATGITLMITLLALVNAAVTLGILPTTGQPMPFVSYGGSSMLFSAFAVGVLLNISSQTDLHPRLLPLGRRARPAEPAVGKVY